MTTGLIKIDLKHSVFGITWVSLLQAIRRYAEEDAFRSKIARQRSELLKLDDRLLKDIGIGSTAAVREACRRYRDVENIRDN